MAVRPPYHASYEASVPSMGSQSLGFRAEVPPFRAWAPRCIPWGLSTLCVPSLQVLPPERFQRLDEQQGTKRQPDDGADHTNGQRNDRKERFQHGDQQH